MWGNWRRPRQQKLGGHHSSHLRPGRDPVMANLTATTALISGQGETHPWQTWRPPRLSSQARARPRHGKLGGHHCSHLSVGRYPGMANLVSQTRDVVSDVMGRVEEWGICNEVSRFVMIFDEICDNLWWEAERYVSGWRDLWWCEEICVDVKGSNVLRKDVFRCVQKWRDVLSCALTLRNLPL